MHKVSYQLRIKEQRNMRIYDHWEMKNNWRKTYILNLGNTSPGSSFSWCNIDLQFSLWFAFKRNNMAYNQHHEVQNVRQVPFPTKYSTASFWGTFADCLFICIFWQFFHLSMHLFQHSRCSSSHNSLRGIQCTGVYWSVYYTLQSTPLQHFAQKLISSAM